jgi:hypothetical protein
MRRINNFFCTIIQVVILYFDKLPKLLSEAKIIVYANNAYLHNIPVSYIEAIYEIVLILKSITGLDKRTQFFFGSYNFDRFIEQLIDLGFIQFCIKSMKDLISYLFDQKLHTVIAFLDYLILIYLYVSNSKLSRNSLTKIVNEICELFSKQSYMTLINTNRDNKEVKGFLGNLIELTNRNPNLLNDTLIELYLSHLGLTDNVTLDKNFKLLNLHSSSRRVSKARGSKDVILLPCNNVKTSSWDIADLQTSNYNFIITSGENKRKKQEIDTISFDHFDEYAILALIDYHIKEKNMDKASRIISWRKKILEVMRINGWVVGKILAANTLDTYQITDMDIIEANLNFMENFNSIEKDIKGDDIYADTIEEYERLLLKSLEY